MINIPAFLLVSRALDRDGPRRPIMEHTISSDNTILYAWELLYSNCFPVAPVILFALWVSEREWLLGPNIQQRYMYLLPHNQLFRPGCRMMLSPYRGRPLKSGRYANFFRYLRYCPCIWSLFCKDAIFYINSSIYTFFHKLLTNH